MRRRILGRAPTHDEIARLVIEQGSEMLMQTMQVYCVPAARALRSPRSSSWLEPVGAPTRAGAKSLREPADNHRRRAN